MRSSIHSGIVDLGSHVAVEIHADARALRLVDEGESEKDRARVIQNLLKFYCGLLALAQDVRVYHELSDDDAQVLIHREPHRFQQVGITPILMQAF